jgi:hypothetical protein
MKRKWDWEDDLLTNLLECGSGDIDKLGEVITLAERFGITMDDITDLAYEESSAPLNVNDLISAAMKLTLKAIADMAEELGETDVAEELRDHEIYVNYIDSYFNLDSLDGGVGRLKPMQIVKRVIKEVKRNMQ